MISNEEIKRRRIWNHEAEMWVDEVEYTAEFEEAMELIQPILDSEFGVKPRFGVCHAIWSKQKELLAEHGINWLSPAELNPEVIFD